MMGTLYQSIEVLAKEKGIDPQIIRDAIKDAMLVVARKHFHTEEDLVAEFDDTGAIQIFGVRQVVEVVADPNKEISIPDARQTKPDAEIGSEVRFPRPTDVLGRISAQTFKQVILQKVREAERENIFSEYSGRVGELVNCVIKRIEGPDLVADMGKTEVRIPKKEQSKLESFSVGDRIRAVIKSVDRTGKNAGVVVSRAAPELVMRLFEQEVPEIYDNTVSIRGCAREAGERTKIAVSSRDRDVDSVGACVGMKGMRVQSIIRELRGEKIDIIEFSDDPVVFATHALSPAKISRITVVDPVGKHMEVVVDDTQLSLAIGKKGQNVRLAARLLGWRVDIKSEEEKRQEVESQMAAMVVPGAPVSVLSEQGLPESLIQQLMDAGIPTVEQLGSMTPEQLQEVPGIDPEMVEKIQNAVVAYYGQYEGAMEEPAAESGPGPVQTEAGPGPVQTEAGPGPVQTEAGPGPVQTDDESAEDGNAPTSAGDEAALEESPVALASGPDGAAPAANALAAPGASAAHSRGAGEVVEPRNESVTIENTEPPQ